MNYGKDEVRDKVAIIRRDKIAIIRSRVNDTALQKLDASRCVINVRTPISIVPHATASETGNPLVGDAISTGMTLVKY